MKTLVAHPTGPGSKLIDIKNTAGRTALGEVEMAGWDAGAAWLASVMDINESKEGAAEAEGAELTDEITDVDGTEPLEIHVEVQDAEGGRSRRTINADGAVASGGSRTTAGPA